MIYRATIPGSNDSFEFTAKTLRGAKMKASRLISVSIDLYGRAGAKKKEVYISRRRDYGTFGTENWRWFDVGT